MNIKIVIDEDAYESPTGVTSFFSWKLPKTQECLLRLFDADLLNEQIDKIVVTKSGLRAYFSSPKRNSRHG